MAKAGHPRYTAVNPWSSASGTLRNFTYETWDEFEVLYKNWEFSFDIFPTAISNDETEIIRFGAEIFKISFREKSSKLSIENNGEVYELDEIPLHEWTSMLVRQNQKIDGSFDFSISINRVEA